MLTVEQRIDELWRRGRLRWKLYPAQREVYDSIAAFLDDPATRFEQFYFDISRQFGKTFMGVLVATERALRNPGWRVLYCSATRAALWQFVQPNIDTLLADCPADLRPVWNTTDNTYHFGNGSQIHLAGVNNGHENDARGPKADLIINEEAAFVDRLKYLVESIETPMLTTTGGRILHITTRPESPAHEVTAFRVKCEEKGHYSKRTLDDATHVSPEARAKLIEQLGGRDSTTVKRECFCEDVIDEDRAAVPEFTAHKGAIVMPVQAPPYLIPLVAADVGFEDPTFVGYGFWDFKRAKLCIQREAFLRRATTDVIAAEVKRNESELWPWAAAESDRGDDGRYRFESWRTERRITRRYSDTDLRLIADLNSMHALGFQATRKDAKEAQVNELRMMVKDERIEIDPSCVHLVRHLETTLWNKQRSEWERSAEGHGDGVDMLLYMLRNAPRSLNPYPPKYAHLDPRTHFIPDDDEADAQRSQTGRSVAALFRRAR